MIQELQKNVIRYLELVKDNKEKEITERALKATYKAQKKYGFELGKEEDGPTWNNESDAFKHTYMQWYMTWKYGNELAKLAGDYHELSGKETIPGEHNMDYWNNRVGRNLAKDMLKMRTKKSWEALGEDYIEDYVAETIFKKMRKGELITHPSDPRKFVDDGIKYTEIFRELGRLRKTIPLIKLRDATPDKVIPLMLKKIEYEGINPRKKVFTMDEIKKMGKRTPQRVLARTIKDCIDGKGLPTKENLDKRVSSNELIYVHSYVKRDGTKVSGYYRRNNV